MAMEYMGDFDGDGVVNTEEQKAGYANCSRVNFENECISCINANYYLSNGRCCLNGEYFEPNLKKCINIKKFANCDHVPAEKDGECL